MQFHFALPTTLNRYFTLMVVHRLCLFYAFDTLTLYICVALPTFTCPLLVICATNSFTQRDVALLIYAQLPAISRTFFALFEQYFLSCDIGFFCATGYWLLDCICTSLSSWTRYVWVPALVTSVCVTGVDHWFAELAVWLFDWDCLPLALSCYTFLVQTNTVCCGGIWIYFKA